MANEVYNPSSKFSVGAQNKITWNLKRHSVTFYAGRLLDLMESDNLRRQPCSAKENQFLLINTNGYEKMKKKKTRRKRFRASSFQRSVRYMDHVIQHIHVHFVAYRELFAARSAMLGKHSNDGGILFTNIRKDGEVQADASHESNMLHNWEIARLRWKWKNTKVRK